jgi:hypothetical protein
MSHRKVIEIVMDYRMWLMTSKGQHCGYLRLNSADDMQSLEETENSFTRAPGIELVATCKGCTRDIFPAGEDWDDILA